MAYGLVSKERKTSTLNLFFQMSVKRMQETEKQSVDKGWQVTRGYSSPIIYIGTKLQI
jgi:hypothetical protein